MAKSLTPAAKISLIKLRLAMIGTFAAITAIATLILLAVLSWLNLPLLSLHGILAFVVFMHILQWIIGPYLIEAIYKVRKLEPDEYPRLQESFKKIALASGFKGTPVLKIAEIDIPNAFAYGNLFTGSSVAVTRGLLRNLPEEEIEAVIGHELGHIKHRDVAFMLMISIIPALIYYLGYMLYLSGWFRVGTERERGAAYLPLIGIGLMALSFIFNLFVFYFSRLREYYADAHSARTISGGAKKLQRALARIMMASGRVSRYERFDTAKKVDELKMFFIADPDKTIEGYGDVDDVVERIKNSKPNIVAEIFSTHPDPSKRLRYLDKFI